MKPKLYIHVSAAAHFLEWEVPLFKQWFDIVSNPSSDAHILAVGPDVMYEAAGLPANRRFLVQFPGFGHNPLHNYDLRLQDLALFDEHYDRVFVNPGPLEIAYSELSRLTIYPPCVNTKIVPAGRYRTRLDSLLHVSSRTAQKDWQRSAAIMAKTRLRSEVFPPRNLEFLQRQSRRANQKSKLLAALRIPHQKPLPLGYVSHAMTIEKYRKYDGFVHVARDVAHPGMIDGKYTATVMEAALTGAIIFWHDTLRLGNSFETIFELPLNTRDASELIQDVRASINIEQHSRLTREEFLEKVDPAKSVRIRAEAMMESIEA